MPSRRRSRLGLDGTIGLLFELGGAGTVPGERVVVTGSRPEFGAWTPSNPRNDRALRLRTSERLFPRWASEMPLFLQVGTESASSQSAARDAPSSGASAAAGAPAAAAEASSGASAAVASGKAGAASGGAAGAAADVQPVFYTMESTAKESPAPTTESRERVLAGGGPGGGAGTAVTMAVAPGETEETVVIEYKFVIEKEITDIYGRTLETTLRWEEGDNRRIELPRKGGLLWIISSDGFDVPDDAKMAHVELKEFDLEAYVKSYFEMPDYDDDPGMDDCGL